MRKYLWWKNTLSIFLLLLSLLPFCSSAACDPFTPQCRKKVDTLAKYPVSTLRMAGTIDQNGKLWAIIQTPDKHVYAVATGNPIGVEGGHVLHITPEQLTIQQEKNTVTIWLRQVQL